MPERGQPPGRGEGGGGWDSCTGWTGQSGVLAPWDVTAVVAPRLPRHLPSTSDLGIK